PWIIHGLMRTSDAYSPLVGSGSVLFTLLGYMGLYALLSLLYLALMARALGRGPEGGASGQEA
ncbi:MAG: cytochrome ubiquinol oxidase subunit I, partial [bacterium]